ncbi:MAG TPA: tripartite tricarboxylate transporter TctB family protein [Burkholderiales bacterium]|nr:tripartite tricarboxylate transporter TctB family protein [Burkholderiales bacterium]
MKVELRNNKRFLSGLMFIGIGGIAMLMARDYPMGSALRMGPGYFPNVLSGVIILFGLGMLLKGVVKPERVEGTWSLRALCILPLATVIFGLLMEHAGFIPALIVLILVSAYAGNQFKLLEVILLAIGLTIACWAVFILGLGLPYPLILGM